MKRIFDIRLVKDAAEKLEKIASKLRSSSKFQIAYKKSQNGKTKKVKKSISADLSYDSSKKVGKVDVHETSKRGHKNRHYILKAISEKEFNKLHEYLNEENWAAFFIIINKFNS